MRYTATTDVVRIMGVWVRRADAGLARSAARNAAHSMEDRRTRELDDARTLRDLRNLAAVATPATPTGTPQPDVAAQS
jgi:hypothetical protein